MKHMLTCSIVEAVVDTAALDLTYQERAKEEREQRGRENQHLKLN